MRFRTALVSLCALFSLAGMPACAADAGDPNVQDMTAPPPVASGQVTTEMTSGTCTYWKICCNYDGTACIKYCGTLCPSSYPY